MGLFDPPRQWFDTGFLTILKTGHHTVHVKRLTPTGFSVIIMRKEPSPSGAQPWAVGWWNPDTNDWENRANIEKPFVGDDAREAARAYIEQVIGGVVDPIPVSAVLRR